MNVKENVNKYTTISNLPTVVVMYFKPFGGLGGGGGGGGYRKGFKGGHIDSAKFQQTKKHLINLIGQTFNKFKQFRFFVAKGSRA